MTEYLALFLISMASSFHCVGMCGGIAGMHRGWIGLSRSRTVRLIFYHAGRIGAYLSVGALFGAFGMLLLRTQRLLSLVTGVVIIWISIMALFSSPAKALPFLESIFASLFGWVKGRQGSIASLCFGIFHGLLPCSLVYAFAAKAASTGSVSAGVFTMISFGLGTVPALLFSAKLLDLFTPAVRARFISTGTFFLLILGVITLLRAFIPLHAGHEGSFP
jgi:sulfite exporter TauE/SafE